MDWFTSDTHYRHSNICRGVSNWPDKSGCRNFDTLEQMDDVICDNINKFVQPNDTLFHLGDISFGGRHHLPEWRERINCRNILLIYGNHDHHIRKNIDFQRFFISCQDMYTYRSGKTSIVLCHYAMRIWDKSHHGRYHLYGHSHGTLPDDLNSLSIDIGVDTDIWEHDKYTPYSLDEIHSIMSKKNHIPIDHHNTETN